MSSSDQLKQLRETDITAIDRSRLVDINSVHIETALPGRQRLQKYLEEIKNPYCFLCGGTPVKIRFNSSGAPLQTALKNYFTALKRG